MRYLNKVKELWSGLDESWRVAVVIFLVVRIFYGVWSGVVLMIEPAAVHYVDIEGKPAVIFLDLYSAKIYTYFREANGQILNFEPAGKDTVFESQTGSYWNIESGIATEGQAKGSKLPPAKYNKEDIFPYYGNEPYPNAWLGLWQRFDVNSYLSIAQNGYGSHAGDYAFPPLLPLMIRIFQFFTGNAFLAGLLVSHICTLYAIKLLYDLFTSWSDQETAKQAIVFWLLFPTSFFLFSVYTESLFLVFALLAMRYMKAGFWHWAGFFIFLAILTRIQGVALLVPLLYLIWKDRHSLRASEAWIGLIVAGLGILFYSYLRMTFKPAGGSPFSEPVWHAQLVPPWETYLFALKTIFSGSANYIDLINWFVVTLVILLIVFGWQKIPVEYNLYSIFSLLIMLSRMVENEPLVSMSRYSLTLFPVFFILYLSNKTPWRKRFFIYTCFALSLFLSQLFFVWGWVA